MKERERERERMKEEDEDQLPSPATVLFNLLFRLVFVYKYAVFLKRVESMYSFGVSLGRADLYYCYI